MGASFKKVLNWIAPDAEKEDDGRDKWPSRASFVLAAMGGAVGLGNLLRYPSVVFANNGLAWFIPYLIALTFLGIPVLLLEITIGQAYRGSVVVAFHGINKHTKGVGFAVIMTGFIVATYYVPILAWTMHYFRASFQTPLPWKGRGRDFYMDDVIANPDPITPESGFIQYPETGMVAETVGWCAFMWFCIWLCMVKGVATTGRVVYFTMGLPVIMLIILLGRSLTLENAKTGVKYYFAEWNGWRLADGTIWQGACGQIFFSIGVGFGYFTSYASYNSKFSNAVQDALIIACCNSLYEVTAGFAVFAVIGFLGYSPDDPDVSLSTFTVGFLTYPLALAEMPGSNVWAVLFFLTLAILGLSSAFALLESLVTMICDSTWAKNTKASRPIISSSVVAGTFLLSLIYCTKFGFYLLDAIDTWTNNLCLVFVVWSECVCATTLYRFKDVIGQVGLVPYVINNVGYVMAMVLGVAVGQTAGPEAGAGTGFGIFIVTLVVAILLSKNPDSIAPRFWGRRAVTNKFWWLAFYSSNQLRRDLNVVVKANENCWPIPTFWAPILRYISAPILAIVVSFAYPAFKAKSNDPLQVFAFTVAHCVMTLVAVGFVLPRWFDVFVPENRRHLSKTTYAPQVTVTPQDIRGMEVAEEGNGPDENSSQAHEDEKQVK